MFEYIDIYLYNYNKFIISNISRIAENFLHVQKIFCTKLMKLQN